MKRWTQVFRALANMSRLRIIKLLSDGRERHVSGIAQQIHVTFRGTSQHLILLSNLNILKNEGRDGHVYYSLNDRMPKDAKRAIALFLNRTV